MVHYRLKKNMTQEDLARRLYIDRSLISRFENGKRSLSSDMSRDIFDVLNINLSIDEKCLSRYDKLFEELYLRVIKSDKDGAKEFSDKLDNWKDEILASIDRYRYYLYISFYKSYLRELDDIEVLRLFDYEAFYDDEDRQLLYMEMGKVYYWKEKNDEAEKWLNKAIEINPGNLRSTMCKYYMIKIFSDRDKHYEAYILLHDCIKTFMKYDIKAKAVNCIEMLAIIHIRTKQYAAAANIFSSLLKKHAKRSKDIKRLTNSLLWALIEKGDRQGAYHLITKNLDDPKFLNYRTLSSITYFACMNDDGELIDRCTQTYDKIDDHNDICELMSEYFIACQRRYLLKAKEIYRTLFPLLQQPQYADELEMILETLAKLYSDLGMYKDAVEIYRNDRHGV